METSLGKVLEELAELEMSITPMSSFSYGPDSSDAKSAGRNF